MYLKNKIFFEYLYFIDLYEEKLILYELYEYIFD